MVDNIITFTCKIPLGVQRHLKARTCLSFPASVNLPSAVTAFDRQEDKTPLHCRSFHCLAKTEGDRISAVVFDRWLEWSYIVLYVLPNPEKVYLM